MEFNLLNKTDEDILKKIKTLSYYVFSKSDEGNELLNLLFYYHLFYISPTRGEDKEPMRTTYECGIQDAFRMLYNYTLDGEEIVKNGE